MSRSLKLRLLFHHTLVNLAWCYLVLKIHFRSLPFKRMLIKSILLLQQFNVCTLLSIGNEVMPLVTTKNMKVCVKHRSSFWTPESFTPACAVHRVIPLISNRVLWSTRKKFNVCKKWCGYNQQITLHAITGCNRNPMPPENPWREILSWDKLRLVLLKLMDK